MKAIEVLKMLKSKIDAAAQINCNYAIEVSDIEAIDQALNLAGVSNNEAVCPKCASKDVVWTVYCNDCNEAM